MFYKVQNKNTYVVEVWILFFGKFKEGNAPGVSVVRLVSKGEKKLLSAKAQGLPQRTAKSLTVFKTFFLQQTRKPILKYLVVDFEERKIHSRRLIKCSSK